VIPDRFKQDLLHRVDLVDVVSRYVQLKKGGANYLGLCPFHNEKTPSFTVSPAKQFYHCFGCGAHGNAIGFLMAYSGLGYVDAVRELASSVGMQMPEWQPRTPQEAARKERETDLYEVMEAAMAFYRAELKKSPRAIDYLKGRGLTGEIAARYRIGYAPDDWQALRAAFPDYEDKALVECGLVVEGEEGKRYDRFRDRVMFPILSARGAVIGFGGRVLADRAPADDARAGPKYLNSPETPLFEKGRELYGLVQAREAIRETGRALVVEGYMDVVALAQHGVRNAVATLGTATTPVHVSKLLRLADELLFCFDGDAAGRKAAWRALEVCLPLAPDHKPIRFLFLPEGEDPDSFVRAGGREAFEKLAAASQTLSEFLLAELRAPAQLATAEGRSRFLSLARPHLHKIAAPALRLQVVKEVAVLAGVSQEEADRLLGLQSAPDYTRRAPQRARFNAPRSPEWSLLANVLVAPELIRQLDPELLTPGLAESEALGALRTLAGENQAEPSFLALFEGLEGTVHIDTVLLAHQFAEEVGLDAEAARREFQAAQDKLEIARRGRELDAMRERVERGLASKDEFQRYNEKLKEYKRMQGALPGA
jgi:DNA primase